MKVKFKPGITVETNGRFAKIVGNRRPFPGVLMRPLPHPAGSWLVRLDQFNKPHHVHEKLLESFTMELETTAEAWGSLPKTKQVHLVWAQASKSASWPEWHAAIEGENLPARIRELDKKSYSVYRNGKYLGSEATFDDAKKRAVVNQVSQKNRVMRIWEREHPNELPPGLQLTDAEREEYWRVHAASKPKAASAGGLPKQALRQPRVDTNDIPEAGKEFFDKATLRQPKEPAERKPRTSVPGGMTTKIAELLKRKDGCTREDVLAATGWTAVSMQQQAKQAGLTLRVDKSRKPFRYYDGESK